MSLDSSGTVTISGLQCRLVGVLLDFLPLRGLRLGALLGLTDLRVDVVDCSRMDESSVCNLRSNLSSS